MPRRSTHLQVGATIGGGAAALRAHDQPSELLLIEVVGGVFGGAIGGVTPDIIEPATSPNHRGIAHSVVAGGSLTLAKLAEWQAECRRKSAAHTQRSLDLRLDSSARSDAELAAVTWTLLSGFLVGFLAGYLSHLALDALTPRSLPTLGA